MSDPNVPAQSETPTDNDRRRCEAYANISRSNRHFLQSVVDSLDPTIVDEAYKVFQAESVLRSLVNIKSENARYRRASILKNDMGFDVPTFPAWDPTA